jgi:hypothetical protein
MRCSFVRPLVGREKDEACSRCIRNGDACFWREKHPGDEKWEVRPRSFTHGGKGLPKEERAELINVLLQKLDFAKRCIPGFAPGGSAGILSGSEARPFASWTHLARPRPDLNSPETLWTEDEKSSDPPPHVAALRVQRVRMQYRALIRALEREQK